MNFNQRLKIAPAVNRALFRVGSRMAFIPRVRVECHSQSRGLSQLHRAALAMVCSSGFKLPNSNGHMVQNSRYSTWPDGLPKIPKCPGVTHAASGPEAQCVDKAGCGTAAVLVSSLRSQVTKPLPRYYLRAREARWQEGPEHTSSVSYGNQVAKGLFFVVYHHLWKILKCDKPNDISTK